MQYWDTNDNSSIEHRVFNADDDFAILTNLLPYTQYGVSVLAYNAAGDGLAVNPPLFVTTAQSGIVSKS